MSPGAILFREEPLDPFGTHQVFKSLSAEALSELKKIDLATSGRAKMGEAREWVIWFMKSPVYAFGGLLVGSGMPGSLLPPLPRGNRAQQVDLDELLRRLHAQVKGKQDAFRHLDLIAEERLDLNRALHRMQDLADIGDILRRDYPKYFPVYYLKLAAPLLQKDARALNFALASTHLEDLRELADVLVDRRAARKAITARDVKRSIDRSIAGTEDWEKRISSSDILFEQYYLPGFPIIVEIERTHKIFTMDEERRKLDQAAKILHDTGWQHHHPVSMTHAETVVLSTEIEYVTPSGEMEQYRHYFKIYIGEDQTPEDAAAVLVHEDNHVAQDDDARFATAQAYEKAHHTKGHKRHPWLGPRVRLPLSRLLTELDSYGIDAEWTTYLWEWQNRRGSLAQWNAAENRKHFHRLFIDRLQAREALTFLRERIDQLDEAGKELLGQQEDRWNRLDAIIQPQWGDLLDHLLSSEKPSVREDGFLFLSNSWNLDPMRRPVYAEKFWRAFEHEVNPEVLLTIASVDEESEGSVMPSVFRQAASRKLDEHDSSQLMQYLDNHAGQILSVEPLLQVIDRHKAEAPDKIIDVWDHVALQVRQFNFWDYVNAVLDGSVHDQYGDEQRRNANKLADLPETGFERQFAAVVSEYLEQWMTLAEARQAMSKNWHTFLELASNDSVVHHAQSHLRDRKSRILKKRLNEKIYEDLLMRENLRRWASGLIESPPSSKGTRTVKTAA